jgi:hypothetical protein
MEKKSVYTTALGHEDLQNRLNSVHELMGHKRAFGKIDDGRLK